MGEVHLTSQQVKDLTWLLAEMAETLRGLDTFKSDLLAQLGEEAALTLLDRLYGKG